MKAQTDEDIRHEAETKLRLWAFSVYFRKSFKRERDPEIRFTKALVASTRPVTDVDLETLAIGSGRGG